MAYKWGGVQPFDVEEQRGPIHSNYGGRKRMLREKEPDVQVGLNSVAYKEFRQIVRSNKERLGVV